MHFVRDSFPQTRDRANLTSSSPYRVVVLGVGNEDRGDDAVGLLVARRLREEVPPGVEVVESDGDPARLLDLWQGADLAVAVDAVVSGGEAGALHLHDATREALPSGLATLSSHGLGLAQAIELGRALGRLPARLVVIGIEAAEVAPGGELSPAVAAAIGRAVALARRELELA